MENIYLHFKSSVRFSLFIDGEYVDLCDKCKSLTIATKNKNISYIICPIEEGETFSFDSGIINISKEGITTPSKNIDIIKFDKNQFEINYVPQTINKLSKSSIINQNNIDGIAIVVYNGVGGFIDVFSKDGLIMKESTISNISICDIEKINKYIIVQSVLTNERRHIIVFNKDNIEEKISYVCDSLEIDNNSLKILIDLNNYLKIAKVISFDLASGVSETEFIFLEKQEDVRDDNLVPYVFLTAIKDGCYKLAKSYLGEEFKDVDDMHLKEFFGEIKDFYYDAYRQDDKIIYAIKTDKINLYEFVVDNGKIQDILDK